MEEKEIYEMYGKAMIELEIAQGRVNSLKQEIAKLINKPQKVEEVKEE